MGTTPGQTALDQLTLQIFMSLSAEANANARRSASQILGVSSAFLSKQAHDALSNFHKLYFDQSLKEKKQQINDDVTKLFEEAQALMDSGGAAALDGLQDDSERAKERIGIAHMQKQLEALITLNSDFKDRLVPVLSSMQFEDAMSQRLSHIELAWTKTVEALTQKRAPDFVPVAQEVAKALSSDGERQIYYKTVMREEAPEGLDEQSIWIDLSA